GAVAADVALDGLEPRAEAAVGVQDDDVRGVLVPDVDRAVLAEGQALGILQHALGGLMARVAVAPGLADRRPEGERREDEEYDPQRDGERFHSRHPASGASLASGRGRSQIYPD